MYGLKPVPFKLKLYCSKFESSSNDCVKLRAGYGSTETDRRELHEIHL